MTTDNPTTNYTYAAFISYRHLPHDIKVAKRVQRAIETYRLPQSLQSTKKADDSVNEYTNNLGTDKLNAGKLGKCFRDEDELSTSPSLPQSIRTALAESHSLILICSPETQKSTWIQQEIKAFIELRGREHIICVLADGDPKEAIPELLLSQADQDSPTGLSEASDEPLAADMRKTARAKQRTELLRIIAGVAECNFDDLRQREKTRHTKRVALGTAAAICFAIILAFFIIQSSNNSKEALIANSKALAAQSEQQLSRGERIQAIETALSALPTSSEHPNRPLVTEAQTALENALYVNQKSINLWEANFAFDAETDIVSFASNRNENWVAILEKQGTITVLDIYTGKILSQTSLKNYGFTGESVESDEWTIVSAGSDRFIVANRTGEGSIACINIFDGEPLWEEPDIAIDAIAISDNEEIGVMFTINDDGAVLVGQFATKTGDILTYIETIPNCAFRTTTFQPCSYVSKTNTAYLGFGSFVHTFCFDSELSQQIMFEGTMINSLQGTPNLLLGASSDKQVSDNDRRRPYYFEAFDITKNDVPAEKQWSQSGAYKITIAGGPYQALAYEGPPTIQCYAYEGTPATVCTAGSELNIF